MDHSVVDACVLEDTRAHKKDAHKSAKRQSLQSSNLEQRTFAQCTRTHARTHTRTLAPSREEKVKKLREKVR